MPPGTGSRLFSLLYSEYRPSDLFYMAFKLLPCRIKGLGRARTSSGCEFFQTDRVRCPCRFPFFNKKRFHPGGAIAKTCHAKEIYVASISMFPAIREVFPAMQCAAVFESSYRKPRSRPGGQFAFIRSGHRVTGFLPGSAPRMAGCNARVRVRLPPPALQPVTRA